MNVTVQWPCITELCASSSMSPCISYVHAFLSLAGGATTITFVTTNMCVCCDVFVVTKLLMKQNFCHDKKDTYGSSSQYFFCLGLMNVVRGEYTPNIKTSHLIMRTHPHKHPSVHIHSLSLVSHAHTHTHTHAKSIQVQNHCNQCITQAG